MQTSFGILFVVSMIVPVAAVVVGTAVLVGATLLNRQGHAGDAEAPHQRDIPIGHPAGH